MVDTYINACIWQRALTWCHATTRLRESALQRQYVSVQHIQPPDVPPRLAEKDWSRAVSQQCLCQKGCILAMSRKKRRIACMVRLSGCRRPCTWRQFFRTEPDAAHSTSSPVARVGLATMLPKSTHRRHENRLTELVFFVYCEVHTQECVAL